MDADKKQKQKNAAESLTNGSQKMDDGFKQLTPELYQQLRGLARKYMRGERDGHTYQPTELLNEALSRLARVPAILKTANIFMLSVLAKCATCWWITQKDDGA